VAGEMVCMELRKNDQVVSVKLAARGLGPYVASGHARHDFKLCNIYNRT
jgi:hypothetical protein